MGCIKLDILENHYKTPELKIVYAKKELTSKKSSSEGRNYYHARYYDPRTSVWQSVDPKAAEAPGWSPYRAFFNNPIMYIDPDGQFELPAAQAKKHQRLAHYLKNGVQEIANNKTVMASLMKYGQFTEKQIQSALEWGEGPKINVTQLGKSKTGSGDRAGLYSPKKYGANTLNIDIDLVERLESATGDDRDIVLFQVAKTILHEYVHLGDAQDGVDYKGAVGNGEEGNAFEIESYGKDIKNLYDATDVLNDYNKRHGIDKQYNYPGTLELPEIIITAPKQQDEK